MPHLLLAQGDRQLSQKIRGVVTDEASGQSLPFVSVVLDGSQTGVTTDEYGAFSLENVPVGRHSLHVSCMGFEAVIVKEILVGSAREVFLEIQLKENTYQLDEIAIRPRINKEEPLNKMALSGARMLSVEEARRYAGGMDDPGRLAASFAGVSPGVGDNGISIHGNAPHLLQWRLEDVEIPNPNHFADVSVLGGGILSSLSSHILANSDFFTGAFPAEYGNAVSGVFDMKMRNGNNQTHEHTFQAGILGIDFASEGPLSRKHHSSYLFNYRYSTTSLLDKLGSPVEEGSTIDYQDLNFKLNFPTRNAGVFSVWATALIDKYDDRAEQDREKWESMDDRQRSVSDQTMAAGGISHRYFYGNNAQLKTTLAATFSQGKVDMDITDYSQKTTPYMTADNRYTNLIFKTSFNKKFSPRFTNMTGVTYTGLLYDMDFYLAPHEGYAPENISRGDGSIDLISIHNSSLLSLGDKLDMSVGIHAQAMTLNSEWTVEPRASLRWRASGRGTLAVAGGLYSRMEKMDVYFVKTKGTAETENKKLGFTKSQHLMLAYNYRISDDMLLKIEPYIQFLYDVPVTADGSYSVLNRREFWVEESLVNEGKGRNAGVDLTIEKYLTKGLYYMLTASLFESKYCGGDGLWHSTRYDRKYIANALAGKEWMLGRNKQNVLSANIKLTLQGGERHSPVDEEATMNDPDKAVQYDETKPFSKQLSPMFLTNLSVSYRINRKNVSHEFALQMLNVTKHKEFYGHHYNTKTNRIEVYSGAASLPNISYKVHF
ncbi:MAG: carboxypeptidase-like regulatory domain-containing protein [Tannerellaceae bacterium]|nr:carboxypeptidase-like regulatory domain-containing protein [Tannerellaceae bacterium]